MKSPQNNESRQKRWVRIIVIIMIASLVLPSLIALVSTRF